MGRRHSPKKKANPLSTLVDLLRDKGIFQPNERSPKSLAELVRVLVRKERINDFDAEKITGDRGKGRYKALLDLLLKVGILDDEDLHQWFLV